MNLNLSIIVVTYNCSAYIERFLNGLFDSLVEYDQYEVLLNDNSSKDDTYSLCEKFNSPFKGAFILSKSDNIGFAKANNMLINRAIYDNVLLLNPDVFEFKQFFWNSLIQKWDKTNPIIVKLLNEDLTIQENVGDELSIKRRLKRISGRSKNLAYSNTTIEVESGIMAFVLITRRCLFDVGLLSEDYFMYAEDHDWFFRARRKGYHIIFEPSLELIHTGGGSAQSKWNSGQLKKVKSEMEVVFIKKYFSGPEKFVLLTMNWIQKFI